MGGEIRYISSIEVNFVNPYSFVSHLYLFQSQVLYWNTKSQTVQSIYPWSSSTFMESHNVPPVVSDSQYLLDRGRRKRKQRL